MKIQTELKKQLASLKKQKPVVVSKTTKDGKEHIKKKIELTEQGLVLSDLTDDLTRTERLLDAKQAIYFMIGSLTYSEAQNYPLRPIKKTTVHLPTPPPRTDKKPERKTPPTQNDTAGLILRNLQKALDASATLDRLASYIDAIPDMEI